MSLGRFIPSVVKSLPFYVKARDWYYKRRFNRLAPQLNELQMYQRISRIGSDSPNPWIAKSAQIDGWLFEGEHELLWEMASYSIDGDILEIGTWQGKSTCILAGACIASGSTARVFCVDTFLMSGTPEQEAYHKRLVKGPGTFYQFLENARRFDFEDRVVVLATPSSRILPYLNIALKLALLDGTHDYDAVCQDITLTKPLIVPGGSILLHDSSRDWPDVPRAIADSLAPDPRFRPVKKVNSLECWERVE